MVESVFFYSLYKCGGVIKGEVSVEGFLNDIISAENAVLKGNYENLCYFNSVLWFLPCFFVCECLFFILGKIIDKKCELFYCCLYITTIANLGLLPWIGEWHITEAWSYLIWIALGFCARDMIKKFMVSFHIELMIGVSSIGFVLLTIFVGFLSQIDKAKSPLIPIGIISLILISGAFGRILEEFNWKVIERGISNIGQSTLLILLIHFYFVDEIHKTYPWIQESVIASIIVSIIIVVIIAFIRWLFISSQKIIKMLMNCKSIKVEK